MLENNAMLERTVRVGSRDIFAAEAGEGAPLLMLHGGGPGASGAPNFERNIPILSRHFRVIVPDMPGYGRSTKGIDRKDPFGDLARTMLGLLDVLGVSRAHVLGNSLGGACALRMALEKPDAIERLVLMGPGGIDVTRAPPTEGLGLLLDYYAGEGPTREKMATFLRHYLVYDGSRIPDCVVEARFRDSTDPEVVANPPLVRPSSMSDMQALDLTRDERLSRLRTPTLVLWGINDLVNRPSGGHSLQQMVPNCDLYLFSHTGHWVQWERPDEFNAVTIAFLETIGLGSTIMDLSRKSAMNNINANGTAPTAYGSVQLGYVLVDSPRLQEWQRFAADGIGMELAAQAPDTLAFRVDDHARRLIVRKGNDDITLGLQATPEALDLILQRLRRREIDVEAAGGEQAALRGVRKLWRFVGPKRQVIELFTEPLLHSTPPRVKPSGFVTGERGLGHVAITTRKPKEMIAFWQEIFDARISDYIDDRISGVNLHFTFLRVNPRHHSVAVAQTKGLALDPFPTKIQHLEMQVADINDVTNAYRRLRELGFKIAMAVGQHTNDRDVSFYAVTPSEFYFELGWCSAGEHDIETWPQVVHQGISLWGHKPQDQTIGEKLAQVGRGVSSLFRAEYTPF